MLYMEPFEEAVLANPYMREQYDAIYEEFLKLLDCQKTENILYELAARKMINRAADHIPSDDDRELFSKVLVVLLDRLLAERSILRDVKIKLHRTQVILLKNDNL